MNLLITGGAGFIGSNLIRFVLDKPEVEKLVCLDCLTYAGHMANLEGVMDHPRFVFEKIDLRDKGKVIETVAAHGITHVMHLAAESHVDRSISGPDPFLHTNVLGTFHLLEACRVFWQRSEAGGQRSEVSLSSVALAKEEGAEANQPLHKENAGEFTRHSPSTYAKAPVDKPSTAPRPPSTVHSSPSTAHRPPSTVPSPPPTVHRFLHVSTDEVYGSLGREDYFTEGSPYAPNSPYAASKAAADMMVRAYHRTYGLPALITNGSNNYGPYQYPEKLIPVVIQCLVERRPIPVYGDGSHVRDWIFVEDHVEALWEVLCRGRVGEIYNIGAGQEWSNIRLVEWLCDLMDELRPEFGGGSRELIRFVGDRRGHDWRYAIDAGKIRREMGWEPQHGFQEGLRRTVQWYLENQAWVREVTVLKASG